MGPLGVARRIDICCREQSQTPGQSRSVGIAHVSDTDPSMRPPSLAAVCGNTPFCRADGTQGCCTWIFPQRATWEDATAKDARSMQKQAVTLSCLPVTDSHLSPGC